MTQRSQLLVTSTVGHRTVLPKSMVYQSFGSGRLWHLQLWRNCKTILNRLRFTTGVTLLYNTGTGSCKDYQYRYPTGMKGSPLNVADVGRVRSTRFLMAARGSLATYTSRSMRERLRSWRIAFPGRPVRGGSSETNKNCVQRPFKRK